MPNELAAEAHDRMPVVLMDKDYDRWLDPTVDEASKVESLLAPYAGKMSARPVSRLVNNVRNKGPACVDSPK